VSQWLCGETLDILGSVEGWLRCRDDDGYIAWTPAGGVLRVDGVARDAWSASANAFSLGVALAACSDLSGPNRLPFGARVAAGDGGTIQLPDGTTARPSDPEKVVAGRLSPDPEAVLECAATWLGTPYVWGGRSDWGADCSGFIQLVYAAHGIRLPRDSYQQFEAGSPLEETEAATAGDLIFYAETTGRVTHVAICLDERHVLHCSASNAAVAINDMEGSLPLEEKLRQWRVGATRPLAGG
jgi:cell wall-associated NlpC family hydrolase